MPVKLFVWSTEPIEVLLNGFLPALFASHRVDVAAPELRRPHRSAPSQSWIDPGLAPPKR